MLTMRNELMKTGKWTSGGIAGILCMLGILSSAAEARTETLKKVVAAPAVRIQETAPKRYVGTIESIEHVDIIPRVTGELRKINFTEGSMVKKGELLYVLEDTTYRAAVDALRAQKEQIEAALRYATTEYNRSSRLLESKAVAVSSHDKALMEIQTAKAKLKEIAASLVNAENNLSYTRIHAPISGRIGKSAFTVGNLITPQGGKLTDIEQVAPIYVRFSLSERIFRRDFGGRDGLREKAVVRLKLADGSLHPETGKVTLIDNKIGTTTNSITQWATFENRDNALLPGGFATVLVSIRPEKPLAAVVPSGLIMEENGYFVYILDSANKVIRRKVVPGGTAGGFRTVLSGLDGSERVLIDGTHKVKPGMQVDPVAPEALK